MPNLIEDASCEYHPYRTVGRPSLKWDDILNRFCRIHFNLSWQNVPIASFNDRVEQFVLFLDVLYYFLKVAVLVARS